VHSLSSLVEEEQKVAVLTKILLVIQSFIELLQWGIKDGGKGHSMNVIPLYFITFHQRHQFWEVEIAALQKTIL
jgi:hypothetical protein